MPVDYTGPDLKEVENPNLFVVQQKVVDSDESKDVDGKARSKVKENLLSFSVFFFFRFFVNFDNLHITRGLDQQFREGAIPTCT